MSMPTFPDIDPEITCERALNMILASIAMEELALSHILNAEGEKLQYVLGTLKNGSCHKPSVDEVLTVNQSVTNLLDSVSQNQMILKNKMDKALHALSEVCPGHKEDKCHPCDCHYCECPCKCSAVFGGRKKGEIWHANNALPWNTEHLSGSCFRIDPCDSRKIELLSKGRFVINFTVNVMPKSNCECNAAVSLQMKTPHHCFDLFTFHEQLCPNKINTISVSGIIAEAPNNCGISSVSLKLLSPDILTVEDSMLSILEI